MIDCRTEHGPCQPPGPKSVRDVTWMSALSVHLAKWIPALGQVTDSHLVKCPHQLTTWSSAPQDFMNGTWRSGAYRHSAKWYLGLKMKCHREHGEPYKFFFGEARHMSHVFGKNGQKINGGIFNAYCPWSLWIQIQDMLPSSYSQKVQLILQSLAECLIMIVLRGRTSICPQTYNVMC